MWTNLTNIDRFNSNKVHHVLFKLSHPCRISTQCRKWLLQLQTRRTRRVYCKRFRLQLQESRVCLYILYRWYRWGPQRHPSRLHSPRILDKLYRSNRRNKLAYVYRLLVQTIARLPLVLNQFRDSTYIHHILLHTTLLRVSNIISSSVWYICIQIHSICTQRACPFMCRKNS